MSTTEDLADRVIEAFKDAVRRALAGQAERIATLEARVEQAERKAAEALARAQAAEQMNDA